MTRLPTTLRERKISVYYKEPDISADEIKLIYNFWIKDVPVVQMMRRMQPSRVARQLPPLIYVDIYSVLFTLLQAQQITQRRSNPHEMTIKDFAQFFQVWKQGGTFDECYSALIERPEVKSYCTNVFRSTADRYRREQAALTPAIISNGKCSDLTLKQHVLSMAVRRKIDNRLALVIFVDQIPLGLIQQLKALKDIGVHFDSALQSGDEILKRMAAGTADSPGDADLKALDPDGTVEEEGHIRTAESAEEAESRRKLRPKPQTRLEQLDAAKLAPPVPVTKVATADGIKVVAPAMPIRNPPPLHDTTPIEELLEPNELDYSLANLTDEDDLDPLE